MDSEPRSGPGGRPAEPSSRLREPARCLMGGHLSIESIIDSRCSVLVSFVRVAGMRGGVSLLTRRGPATVSWLLLAFAIVWVAIKAFGSGFGITGNGPTFVITALNG